MKNFGLTDRKQAELRQEVEELRGRHNLYGFLYSRFSRFDVISRPADHHEDNFGNNVEGDLENDESVSANVEGDLENDEDDENARNLESIEIFEAKEWEVYLKDIDSERSIF